MVLKMVSPVVVLAQNGLRVAPGSRRDCERSHLLGRHDLDGAYLGFDLSFCFELCRPRGGFSGAVDGVTGRWFDFVEGRAGVESLFKSSEESSGGAAAAGAGCAGRALLVGFGRLCDEREGRLCG
jgi:hypothetical protein